MNVFTSTLADRYESLKQAEPQVRIRDAAQRLKVSELELLELELGHQTIRLRNDWKPLLGDIHTLGKVMALTRNDFAVHERKGVYHHVSFLEDAPMGLVVNEDIDLRLFMQAWCYGYAVRTVTPKQTLYSLQFFDRYGEAIHKIYLIAGADPLGYQQLVDTYRAEDQRLPVKPETKLKVAEVFRPDFEEVEAFRESWRQLRDTHDFYPMLRKYNLCRTQALRLAPAGYAIPLELGAVAYILQAAAANELPIMVFVGNAGCIQIHTGTIKRLVPMEGWLNVMDPDFNLHLRLDGVAEVWLTRKPTDDGLVTAIEVFDQYGEMIVQFFGKRKPGQPEHEAWRRLTDLLLSQQTN